MRILITGASGFIGSHLLSSIKQAGHEAIALSRSPQKTAQAAWSGRWVFGEALPKELPGGVQCAVHLAHDFNGQTGAVQTIASTLRAIADLRERGVQRQLLYSSYSAGPHAFSLYGRTKYALECALVDAPDVSVIRPGLVLGDGGIYGRIKKFAETFPLVPLPDGGRDAVPVIAIDKLCDLTLGLATGPESPKEINLFEAEHQSLRQLVQAAAQAAGKSPHIIPVPTRLVMAALAMAEWLRVPLPVKSDNLEGLIANQRAVHVSSLHEVETHGKTA